MIKIEQYEYNDFNDLIESFKKTLEPKFEKANRFRYSDFTIADEKEYKAILKWLLSNGYYIKQFPNVVNKQTPLNRFAYDEIKAKIRANKRYSPDDSIPWADRRELINELEIIKKIAIHFLKLKKIWILLLIKSLMVGVALNIRQ